MQTALLVAYDRFWEGNVACPLYTAAMAKKRRFYSPRIVGGQVMMPDDLERLHKYMRDIERVETISDEMRAIIGLHPVPKTPS